jgi:tetratricopeptide (TPR) repeat protein
VIEERVNEILTSSTLSAKLKSRALYILGICNCYQDTRHDQAMSYFRQAIDQAVASGDKEALAGPLYGAATVLYARQRFDEALKELGRLEVLMSCLSLPEIGTAALLLRSMIRRNQHRTDEALEAAWAAYESLKHQPHLVLYLHTLCVLGTIYLQKADIASARVYLDLAERSVKRQEFPRIARLIDEAFATIRVPRPSEIDLSFDSRTGVLIERLRGEVRFEGQFILRDLLEAFLRKPGKVFQKDDLVREVWKETYEPAVHDNKIYVTIKRLRKLLENENSNTEYILRAKSGYFLNPKTRVMIDDKVIEPISAPGKRPVTGTEKTV